MPGATPIYNLPYPTPGDPPLGADQLQALAEAVERALARRLATSCVVAVNNSATGAYTLQFPQARFQATPKVVATVVGTSGYVASVGAVDKDSCVVNVRHIDGIERTDTVTVNVIAAESVGS